MIPGNDRMEKKLEILYIGETDEMIEQIARNRDQSVSVTVKNNAMDAVKQLISGALPDGILCDPAIPGGNAFELHRFVREQLGMLSPAFIIVAKEFQDELYVSSVMNKVDDFYVLPFPDGEGLIDRINFLKAYKAKKTKVTMEESKPYFFSIPKSKRLFDIIVASTSLLVLSPLLLMVGLAIRMESRGKVYYTSKRVGREPFDFYKLRSMRVNAEKELATLAKKKNQYDASGEPREVNYDAPCERCTERDGSGSCPPMLHTGAKSICEEWYHYQKNEIAKSKSAFIKIKDDPRITRVGKVIRNLSIDELPQLINVIRGDMSLVGNRPLPVYEAEKLTFDQMAKRFLAPAGLTGLWQVELRGQSGNMSEEERKRLDNDYADIFLQKKYTLWYDIKLILRTIPALFQKESV